MQDTFKKSLPPTRRMSFIMFKIECVWFLSPSEDNENSWSLIIIIQKYSLSYSSFNMLCSVDVSCVELRRPRAVVQQSPDFRDGKSLPPLAEQPPPNQYTASYLIWYLAHQATNISRKGHLFTVSPKLWAGSRLTGDLFGNLPNKHEKSAITSSPWQIVV